MIQRFEFDATGGKDSLESIGGPRFKVRFLCQSQPTASVAREIGAYLCQKQEARLSRRSEHSSQSVISAEALHASNATQPSF